MKIAAKSAELKPGDLLEVIADCPTFEKDVRQWCERTKKTLMWVKDEGAAKNAARYSFNIINARIKDNDECIKNLSVGKKISLSFGFLFFVVLILGIFWQRGIVILEKYRREKE